MELIIKPENISSYPKDMKEYYFKKNIPTIDFANITAAEFGALYTKYKIVYTIEEDFMLHTHVLGDAILYKDFLSLDSLLNELENNNYYEEMKFQTRPFFKFQLSYNSINVYYNSEEMDILIYQIRKRNIWDLDYCGCFIFDSFLIKKNFHSLTAQSRAIVKELMASGDVIPFLSSLIHEETLLNILKDSFFYKDEYFQNLTDFLLELMNKNDVDIKTIKDLLGES